VSVTLPFTVSFSWITSISRLHAEFRLFKKHKYNIFRNAWNILYQYFGHSVCLQWNRKEIPVNFPKKNLVGFSTIFCRVRSLWGTWYFVWKQFRLISEYRNQQYFRSYLSRYMVWKRIYAIKHCQLLQIFKW
jgi:hypothetical protein